ncbi:alpha/beta hydrolase [Pseudonocardia oroxyli]|uniref:Alpha/beta hydrolase family protein n=1 Tax=Pseudonocardia oroxyli TaxID=366584 RepID=A0A1G7WF50_PSEOR|nr:alpha/beta hydrolase [Pseudonocardia oroxyli]SDG70603.1 Alpha/beta hydrolase family protein [Pseudonocardia oroxyli]
MATFLLIPGAGGEPWFFHRVEPELRARGHDPVAVDLPADDESLDWPDYVALALKALGDRPSPVVVAQSMGAFTGALIAAEIPVRHLVLLNPMIPAPGETAGQWWEAVGQEQARREAGYEGFDMERDFLHDIPDFLRADLLAGGRPQSDRSFAAPYPLRAWPDVPTTVVAAADDRLFPLALQKRVARERLGLGVVEVPGGHLNALSYPAEVAAALAAVV